MVLTKRKITNFLAAAALAGLFCLSEHKSVRSVGRFLLVTEVPDDYSERAGVVKDYSQTEIEATAPHLEVFHPRLLVWDDREGFRVYNLDHQDTHSQLAAACGRCGKTVPLMVNALEEHFPERFTAGQPLFQMLWSDADSFQSPCVNKDAEGCDVDNFAPVPLFGSVPKDPSVLPTIKAMPNWFYINCLYNWKFDVEDADGTSNDCWNEHVNDKVKWDDLVNTVLYRGSDFTFLPTYEELSFFSPKSMGDFPDEFGKEDMGNPESILMKLFHHWNELSPRWKAIALSVEAELNQQKSIADGDTAPAPVWIDAKFVGPMREDIHNKFDSLGVNVGAPEHMDPYEMSRYKYQLDLGGGGGTSWRGTLSKLRMPGVLLHHETPTMDWFYPEMKPFKHYIPVHLDLSDLRAKYEWAEITPKRAKQVAAEGEKLAKHLFSEKYMKSLHKDLFVDYLGKVVESYQDPTASTWVDANNRYQQNGFTLTEVVYCRSERCFANVRDDIYRSFPHVIGSTMVEEPATEMTSNTDTVVLTDTALDQDMDVQEALPTNVVPKSSLKKGSAVEKEAVPATKQQVTSGAATFVTELNASKLNAGKLQETEGIKKISPPRDLKQKKKPEEPQELLVETESNDATGDTFISSGGESEVETIDAPHQQLSSETVSLEGDESASPHLIESNEDAPPHVIESTEDVEELPEGGKLLHKKQSTSGTILNVDGAADGEQVKPSSVHTEEETFDLEGLKIQTRPETRPPPPKGAGNTIRQQTPPEAQQQELHFEAGDGSEIVVESLENDGTTLNPPAQSANMVMTDDESTPSSPVQIVNPFAYGDAPAKSAEVAPKQKAQPAQLHTEDTVPQKGGSTVTLNHEQVTAPQQKVQPTQLRSEGTQMAPLKGGSTVTLNHEQVTAPQQKAQPAQLRTEGTQMPPQKDGSAVTMDQDQVAAGPPQKKPTFLRSSEGTKQPPRPADQTSDAEQQQQAAPETSAGKRSLSSQNTVNPRVVQAATTVQRVQPRRLA